MSRIRRKILWAAVMAVRVIFWYVMLGLGGALGLVWPRALFLRWFVLGPVGMRKVEAGALVTAKRYAKELLDLSSKFKDNFVFGNAIHKGNLILGRIALREGDVDAAKHHLLYAGETSGSPNLNSFGPNMTLAKELLEVGEAEVVLDYFDLCKNFWVADFGKLDYWTKIIRSGGIPKFGAQLYY